MSLALLLYFPEAVVDPRSPSFCRLVVLWIRALAVSMRTGEKIPVLCSVGKGSRSPSWSRGPRETRHPASVFLLTAVTARERSWSSHGEDRTVRTGPGWTANGSKKHGTRASVPQWRMRCSGGQGRERKGDEKNAEYGVLVDEKTKRETPWVSVLTSHCHGLGSDVRESR